MKIVELDLTGCKYLAEIHERIRVAFHFPEWYGKNWSAFWDLLWSECDADKAIIKGENSLSGEFDESLSKMHEILERNKKERANGDYPFDYEIVD
ncbi:MAG: barstar family protein [Clostridia bacterium]|nr:barstar family protein [Clostridia bacterium]